MRINIYLLWKSPVDDRSCHVISYMNNLSPVPHLLVFIFTIYSRDREFFGVKNPNCHTLFIICLILVKFYNAGKISFLNY